MTGQIHDFRQSVCGEYEWGRDKGAKGISKTRFIQNVVDRFGTVLLPKPAPSPLDRRWDLRHVSDEKTVMGAN